MDAMRSDKQKRLRRGFTLVELMIVVTVIGIIIAFILTAAMGGIRRAEARATEALISKLEVGIADRLEALTYQQANPTGLNSTPGTVPLPLYARGTGRSRHHDLDSVPAAGPGDRPVRHDQVRTPRRLLRPVPARRPGRITPSTSRLSGLARPTPIPITSCQSVLYFPGTPSTYQGTPSTGIFGASYSVAAGIYQEYIPVCMKKRFRRPRQRSATALSITSREWGGQPGCAEHLCRQPRAQERHFTEMLYAILVEGQGQLGSVFNRDEFKNSEMATRTGLASPNSSMPGANPSTSSAGRSFTLPTCRRGTLPTRSLRQCLQGAASRESLDPNQQLMAPAWWCREQRRAGTYATGNIPSRAVHPR